MRPDMQHKIVERPRFTDSNPKMALRKNRREAKKDPEGVICIRGMRKLHRMNWSDHKELNENLNPLYRYLNKQAGRRWNDVYSEICKQIKLSSAVQLHILQHVDDFVETNVRIINGVPCICFRHNWIPISSYYNNGSYRSMYVDPKNGILKFVSNKKIFHKKKSMIHKLTFRDYPHIQFRIDNAKDDLIKWFKLNDIWYEVKLFPLEKRQIEDVSFGNQHFKHAGYHSYAYVHDVVFRKYYIEIGKLRECYGDMLYSVSKKQLNSKEIKKLMLKCV